MQQGPADGLPPDITRHTLMSIDSVSLAKASCCCREWRAVSEELWPARAQQWRFGKKEHWREVQQSSGHLRLFAERWQIDSHVLDLLALLPQPGERERVFTQLRTWRSDCLDVLLAAAHRFGSGPPPRGLLLRRALMAVQAACAADDLRTLVSQQRCNLLCLETGALHIAQAHSPEVDVHGFVTSYLDCIAAEASARIRALDTSPVTNRQALDVVNQLLFGPRSPDHPFPFANEASMPRLGNPHHEAPWHKHQEYSAAGDAASSSQGHHAWPIPPPGYGLELKGNAAQYYSASNSLLHEVLGRTGLGIPITLCLIHAAVSQRIGLPVFMLQMPMHVMNGMLNPSGTYTGPPPAGSSAQVEDLAAIPPAAFELYIDCFEGGRTQGWDSVLSDLSERILLPILARPRVLTPRGYLYRMCNNLYGVHRSAREHMLEHVVAQLVTAIEPDDPHLFDSRLRCAIQVQDTSDAGIALQEFKMLPKVVEEEYASYEYVMTLQQGIDQVRQRLRTQPAYT